MVPLSLWKTYHFWHHSTNCFNFMALLSWIQKREKVSWELNIFKRQTHNLWVKTGTRVKCVVFQELEIQGCRMKAFRRDGVMRRKSAFWCCQSVENDFLGCGSWSQRETSDLHYEEQNRWIKTSLDSLLLRMRIQTYISVAWKAAFSHTQPWSLKSGWEVEKACQTCLTSRRAACSVLIS